MMIDVDLQTAAETFHEMVSNRSGMLPEGFAMYYQSKKLEGEAALSSWGVEKGVVIEVKTRGRGGGLFEAWFNKSLRNAGLDPESEMVQANNPFDDRAKRVQDPRIQALDPTRGTFETNQESAIKWVDKGENDKDKGRIKRSVDGFLIRDNKRRDMAQHPGSVSTEKLPVLPLTANKLGDGKGPSVYVFSCRYDNEIIDDKTGLLKKGVDKITGRPTMSKNIESTGLVHQLVVTQFMAPGQFFQIKSDHLHGMTASLETKQTIPLDWFPEDVDGRACTIDPAYGIFPDHVPLFVNPNFFHLNGHQKQDPPICSRETKKDCSGDSVPDEIRICDSYSQYEQGQLDKNSFPKNYPCWRSNYYAALKKHNAAFQIVVSGELGEGQMFETRLMKTLGIIPADFNDQANLKAKKDYKSPDGRFIRIHISAMNNTGFDQQSTEDYVKRGVHTRTGVCMVGCAFLQCFTCPFWFPFWCVGACCGTDLCKLIDPAEKSSTGNLQRKQVKEIKKALYAMEMQRC